MVLKSSLLVASATALLTLAMSLGAAPAAQTPAVNLTGTWTGTGHDTYLGKPDGITATWVLTQNGSAVSGTVETLPLDAPIGSCSSCHRVKSGTFTGTISGTALTLTMDFPDPSGGPTPRCVVTIDGAATVASGTFTAAYSGSDSCEVGGILNGTLDMALQSPPEITTQPASQTVLSGQTATFTVAASGNAPLAYRWQTTLDGVLFGTDIPDAPPYSGVTTPTLTVTAGASLNLLRYRCVITNELGSATSLAATLTVHSPPNISFGVPFSAGQVDQTVDAGQDATWVVSENVGVLTGAVAGQTSQWQFSTDHGTSWNDLPQVAPFTWSYLPQGPLFRRDPFLNNRSSGDQLTIANVPAALDALQIRVIVTNPYGSATSSASRLTVRRVTPKRFLTDADGDGRSEVAVFRPAIGGWFVRNSAQGYAPATADFFQWGLPGDVPVAADFDRDGKIDLAVFRPSIGGWFIRKSSEAYAIASSSFYQWGLPGDIPIAGDFDGDGRSDLAVFRPSIGGWFIRYSLQAYSTATTGFYQWGLPGDVPIAADFDGDGRIDLTVFRPATGQWFIRYSSQNYATAASTVYQWGLPGDVPLAGDFDGDGMNDLAVFRPPSGEWFIRLSSQNYAAAASTVYQWGLPGDVPFVVDFDADARTELTVFRPATGEWFIRYSAQNYVVGTAAVYQWGLPGDVPVKP